MKAIKNLWTPYRPKYENDLPVSKIAGYYVKQIKQSNIKTLTFYPLKKSMSASSNQFRLSVLKQVIRSNRFGANQNETLQYLMKGAIEQGFTINEYREL